MAISRKLQGNAWSYRGHGETVRFRLAEVLGRLRQEAALPSVAKRLEVHHARMARITAGAVGAVGGLATLVTGLIALAFDGQDGFLSYLFRGEAEHAPTLLLLGSLVAVLGSYALARLVAPVIHRGWWRRELGRSEDAVEQLAELEAESARTLASRWAARWETLSFALPMTAVAMLGPLTLHGIVWLGSGEIEGFHRWIGASAALVGHAHLAFAAFTVHYVRRLLRDDAPRHAVAKCVGWATLVAAIPGILFFGLPPILTAVTGLFLAWPAFAWAKSALERERLALSS